MVENAINDHPDAALARLLDHFEEQLVRRGPLPRCGVLGFLGYDGQIAGRIRTEPWVNVVEAEGVIFVVRTRPEDRIEVNRVDPEVPQIIELVDDSLNIPPVPSVSHRPKKVVRLGLLPGITRIPVRGPGTDLPRMRDPLLAAQAVAHGIVGTIAIAETFGENLIPNRGVLPCLGVRLQG